MRPGICFSPAWLRRSITLCTILAVAASLNPQVQVWAAAPSFTCPDGPIPKSAGPHFAPNQGWVGNRIVQAVSFWSAHPLRLPFGPGDPHGFGQKVAWRVRPNLRHDVTLTGYNLQTRTPIRFQVETVAALGPAHPLRVGRLNWRTPGISSLGRWRGYSSAIFVPGRGCYTLQAHWQGGGWSLTFIANAERE